MLAAPIMPTTPLLNEKKRLRSRLGDMYSPEPKRCCLDSLKSEEIDVADIGISEAQSQTELFSNFTSHFYLPRLKSATTGLKLLHCNESCYSVPSSCFETANRDSQKKLESVADMRIVEGIKEMDEGNEPAVKLQNRVERKSESPTIKESGALTQCNADSDCCSESTQACIPKYKIKQPAIILTKMSHPFKKKVTPSTLSSQLHPTISSEISSVVVGGYVQRMASLNARACVAAYLEPERRYSRKSPKYMGVSKVKSSSDSKLNCETTSELLASKVHTEARRTKPTILSLNGNEDVIPLKFDGNRAPSSQITEEVDDGSVAYSKEGLLYNGDTIHPDAKVFVTDCHKLQLPEKIVPTLVPARSSTVRRAVKVAASTGVLPSSKKHSKVRK